MTTGPCNCVPYVGGTVIDLYERTVSNAWGTPTRGLPAWVDYAHAETYSSTSSVSVSAIGPSSGWGRIILTLTKPAGAGNDGASHEMQLALPEITDLDQFVLAFDMVVSPVASHQGQAFAQIRLGGTGNTPVVPMIDLPFQFEHFSNPALDHMDFSFARDALGGYDNVRNDTIANVHSFDGRIVIDRSVSRGDTLVTVGDLGTFSFDPISPVGGLGTPEKKLYVSYFDGSSDALSNETSDFSIDNIILLSGLGTYPPTPNQPVQDEFIATGDGTTTAYAARWPYVPNSLQVQVAGMLAELDNSNPATGAFVLTNPPYGPIYATYRAVGG